MDGVRSIGAVARESGLSISALRFYDAAGVLPPASVDGSTGYRWYDPEQVAVARLVAALRRVRMPLADICAVIAARHDPAAATVILDRHLHRLEQGLADARRHLGAARHLLEQETTMTHLTVRAADLRAALDSVRYATATDPEKPALTGILVDDDGTELRLVATDRYRLATAVVPVLGRSGSPAQAILPGTWQLPADAAGDVTIALTPETITIGGERVDAVPAAYPDCRRLFRTDRDLRVRVGDLRDRLRGVTGTDPIRIRLDTGRDRLDLVDPAEPAGGAEEPGRCVFAVNPEFLLQALDSGRGGQLMLAIDGPVTPLALYDPQRPGDLDLLMPIRL